MHNANILEVILLALQLQVSEVCTSIKQEKHGPGTEFDRNPIKWGHWSCSVRTTVALILFNLITISMVYKVGEETNVKKNIMSRSVLAQLARN